MAGKELTSSCTEGGAGPGAAQKTPPLLMSVTQRVWQNISFTETFRWPLDSQSSRLSEAGTGYSKTGHWLFWLGDWKVEGHRWSPGWVWESTDSHFLAPVDPPVELFKGPPAEALIKKTMSKWHPCPVQQLSIAREMLTHQTCAFVPAAESVVARQSPRNHGLLESMYQVPKYVALIPKRVLQVGNREWGDERRGSYWWVHFGKDPEFLCLCTYIVYSCPLAGCAFYWHTSQLRVTALTNVCVFCKLELHYF